MSERILNGDLRGRAKAVKLLLMDCDGVLTDGRLYYSDTGESLKAFHVRDGQGLVSWHEAGFQSGIITGRNSAMVEVRARELGIHFLRQSSSDKLTDFREILGAAGIGADEVAFIGDDIGDLPLFDLVGISIAVRDASLRVRDTATFVTSLKGGKGAVREVIDLLLEAKLAE